MKKIFLLCFGFAISHSAFAVSEKNLQDIIECKTDFDGYYELGADYEEKLNALGWHKDTEETGFLQIYTSKALHQFFGMKTNKIALSGNTIVAMFPQTALETLKNTYKIEKDNSLPFPYFKGEKLLTKTENESFSLTKALVLTDLVDPGKQTHITAFGCSYRMAEK